MARLFYHPGSDCLFVEQHEHIDWNHIPGEEVDDVSEAKWAVDRYNAENPGYKVHLWHGPSNCECPHDRCVVCDGGLGSCVVCGQGECEITTDCPGESPPEHLRVATCAGYIDFWSGVWL